MTRIPTHEDNVVRSAEFLAERMAEEGFDPMEFVKDRLLTVDYEGTDGVEFVSLTGHVANQLLETLLRMTGTRPSDAFIAAYLLDEDDYDENDIDWVESLMDFATHMMEAAIEVGERTMSELAGPDSELARRNREYIPMRHLDRHVSDELIERVERAIQSALGAESPPELITDDSAQELEALLSLDSDDYDKLHPDERL